MSGSRDVFGAMSRPHYSRRSFVKMAGAVSIVTPLGLASACGDSSSGASANTVRYWSWMSSDEPDNPRAAAQGRIIKAFQEKNPDVKVEMTVVPWDQLQQQLMQAVAAGRAPDVCRQLDRSLGDLVASNSLTSLDEFVGDWSEDRKGDYVYDWDDTVIDGHKYAFRHSVRAANRLYYRTDLYEKAGFTAPPVTAEEFLEVSRAVADGKTAGFLQAFSGSDGLSNFMQQCPSMYWSLGSDLVDLETGEPTFQLDAGQQIFQFYQDAVWKHGVMPARVATMNSDGAANVFIAGASAAHLTHSAEWGDWSQREALQGRVATANSISFGDTAAPINTSGAWVLVMPRGANKDAAWRFMEFMQSKEAELIDAEVASELPTRRTTLDDPWFESEKAAYIRQLLEDMQQNSHPATTLKIKKYSELGVVMADAAQKIIANQEDVATALSEAAEAYKKAT